MGLFFLFGTTERLPVRRRDRTEANGKIYIVFPLLISMKTEVLKCDERGRLYLKEAVRMRYGEKFVLVEAPDEIVLLPVPADPLKDLVDLGRKLPKLSLRQLRARIRRRAEQEARQ